MIKLIIQLLTSLLILSPLCALASDLESLSQGTNEIYIEHEAQSRRFIVTTPKTYDKDATYPILFCFHGAGGKADGPSQRFSPHVDKLGFILISAEAVRPMAK